MRPPTACPATSPRGSYPCDRFLGHTGKHQAAIIHPCTGKTLGFRSWRDDATTYTDRRALPNGSAQAHTILGTIAAILIAVLLLAILL